MARYTAPKIFSTSKIDAEPDLRRFGGERRSMAETEAERKICRRYGISHHYSKLIAELQNYGDGDAE